MKYNINVSECDKNGKIKRHIIINVTECDKNGKIKRHIITYTFGELTMKNVTHCCNSLKKFLCNVIELKENRQNENSKKID